VTASDPKIGNVDDRFQGTAPAAESFWLGESTNGLKARKLRHPDDDTSHVPVLLQLSLHARIASPRK